MLRLSDKMELTCLGLMSGTSCDGLDIACVRFGPGPGPVMEVLHAESYDYPPDLREQLLSFIKRGRADFSTVSTVNFALARLWSDRIGIFLRDHGFKPEDIDYIGSHGQTVWHQPRAVEWAGVATASTWQIGDPSVLAALCGIPVVGDFRPADMALGGQGAPLVPYFDHIFFAGSGQNVVSINIGGISNLTYIPADGDMAGSVAFDCGAGNMLIDAACRYYFNRSYDKDGQYASAGKISGELTTALEEWDAFRRQPLPKSTGREDYDGRFVEKIIKKADSLNLSGRDVLATLTRYAADTINEAVERFVLPLGQVDAMYVAGGGAKNPLLMEALGNNRFGAEVAATDERGLPAEFKEAVAFALFARQTVMGRAINVPEATGASRREICGKICEVLR